MDQLVSSPPRAPAAVRLVCAHLAYLRVSVRLPPTAAWAPAVPSTAPARPRSSPQLASRFEISMHITLVGQRSLVHVWIHCSKNVYSLYPGRHYLRAGFIYSLGLTMLAVLQVCKCNTLAGSGLSCPANSSVCCTYGSCAASAALCCAGDARAGLGSSTCLQITATPVTIEAYTFQHTRTIH